MSPSSVGVTYRPAGPGHRTRTAPVDLARIPDPEAWLTNHIGPLAACEVRLCDESTEHVPAEQPAPASTAALRLTGTAERLAPAFAAILADRRAAFDVLAVRLATVAPSGRHSSQPNPLPNSTEANP